MKILNVLNELWGLEENTDASLGNQDAVLTEGTGLLLRLLSPVTPHICDHLWRVLGYGDDILQAPWPEPDPAALQQDEVELVVQVNGKLRGHVKVSVAADRAEVEQAALADENVRRFTAGQTIKKVIIVPGRLVNIVIS